MLHWLCLRSPVVLLKSAPVPVADLVVRDKDGEIYTVRYDAVNAMLLNEFLKEHRKNEEQEATIARQQKQIEALTAELQKVSAQLEPSKPAAPNVVNN